MSKVTFDYSKAGCFVADHEMESMKTLAEAAKETLISKTGAGNDYLGWIDLPVDYDKEEFARIKAAAKKIQEDSEVLLVIGIGGSYPVSYTHLDVYKRQQSQFAACSGKSPVCLKLKGFK